MLILAVTGKIPRAIENATIVTYDELFDKYKHNCKKSYWRTPEGFYLDWLGCETIKQMRQCVFIYPGNEDVANHIRKYYKVLDENDLVY